MSNATLEMVYWINQTAEAWWQSLGRATLQVALVGAVGLVLVSLGRRWSSSLRYGILLILLAKFLIAPAVLLWSPADVEDMVTVEVPVRSDVAREPVAVSNASAPSVVAAPEREVLSQPEVSSVVRTPVLPEPASSRKDPTVLGLITAKGWGWLLHVSGSVVVVLWLLYQSLRLAAWAVRRSEPASAEIQSLCLDVQRQLSYYKPLSVRVAADVGSPMAFQLLKRVIVLPRTTVEKLSREELRPVLAHEIAHLKRRDPLANTLQILLFGIWWFHPVYWWLSRKLRSVREECCDDAVLSLETQREDHYCQTLLDAARSCQTAVVGRVVLGFGESASSMGRRIDRIMDPRTSKRAHLGWLAVAVLAVAMVVSIPMWRTSSSLENPRPVTEASSSRGPIASLLARFGLRDRVDLVMDDAEFAALEDCIEQSHQVRHTRNGVPKFVYVPTRDALLDLHSKMAEPFYAEFLLSKWYEMNNDLDEAARWMAQSLAHAPVVLVRKYELMNGEPMANAPVGSLGIEYRMSTSSQRDTYLVLDYIELTTDEKGQVYLPGYDTKIRCNSITWPRGYDVESGRHGYLALHGRYNLLPTIYTWPKDLPRPVTTLPTSKFYDYRDAVAAQGLTHRIGSTELGIDRCYRIGGAGEVTATNGRERVEPVPGLELESDALDQAVIKLRRSRPGTYEILQTRIFDHDSRTLLLDYHAPAGYTYDGNDTIALRSLGAELPGRLDVWFWVTEFPVGQSTQVVPVQVGSQADTGGYRATLRGLHQGTSGYSTTLGPTGHRTFKFGEPNDPDAAEMQAAFQIEAIERYNQERYGRVAVVTKDGQRYFSDHVVYARDDINIFDFPVALDDVDHFELVPIGRECCFYFDGVSLPERSGPPLETAGSLQADVRTGGRVGRFVAGVTDSISVEVFVVPGRGGISYSSRTLGLDGPVGLESWEPGGAYTETDTRTTIVWRVLGLSTRLFETDISDLSGAAFESQGAGRSGGFYHQVVKVPVDQIQGVRVRLSRAVEP